MRLIATGGIIGIAVVLGPVLVRQDVAGWIVGLVGSRADLGDPGRAALVVAAALPAERRSRNGRAHCLPFHACDEFQRVPGFGFAGSWTPAR